MNFNNSGNYYGYGGSSERIKTKFIIVTGGVISGLGKGVAGAGIGFFFSSDYKVCPIKLDGYLNTDPGTMNPIEHGEVFVLDDGAEVDMDFGHYERFLDISTKNYQSITMGKIFQEIQQKERRGDFLGKTVQFVPHVTDWIQDRILAVGEKSDADFVLVEVGGTVGDLENELFIEGVRQLERRVGHENIIYVHLTYVPIPFGVNEQKTKPTQQSVDLLHKKGIRPDIIIARCGQMLDNNAKRKIALFANINEEDVFTSPDLDSIYKIPAIFENQKLMERISKRLNVICPSKRKLNIWNSLLTNEKDKKVKIAIVGKYTNLEDSYASVVEALQHCSYNLGVEIEVVWVDTSDDSFKSELNEVQGIIVPGGFGTRGVEGKIKAIKFARENGIPFLGICYGL
ncbi:MAG: CTP synthase (glutamine hydrolyzing), partial [Nanoarchaeota archaeon]|nr:CTP synthase (glutamine hydrolyzing) [Nanoarchaeota archaeon]